MRDCLLMLSRGSTLTLIFPHSALIRHLVLPNGIAGSKQVFEWIASNLGKDTSVSLLAQYYPAHKAPQTPLLAHRITEEEYREAVTTLKESGLSTRYAQ